MVCLVVTQNGEGSVWKFATLEEARLHPIPQMTDVYAEDAESLVRQYGRRGSEALLRFLEGRNRQLVLHAVEVWKSSNRDELDSEARKIVWESYRRSSEWPPKEPSAVISVIVNDRRAIEKKPLRGFDARTTQQKELEMSDEKKTPPARKAKFSDDAVITVKAETNPKREGTDSHVRFAKYESGMTVKQAREAGVKAADLSYDSEKGFIAIEEPAAA